VKDLINFLKPNLKTSVENGSEKAIILCRENEDLNMETPITELYNTKENALGVVIDGKR
jgi:hypothetical protein